MNKVKVKKYSTWIYIVHHREAPLMLYCFL